MSLWSSMQPQQQPYQALPSVPNQYNYTPPAGLQYDPANPYQGAPTAPSYTSGYNPSMATLPGLETAMDQNQLDKTGLNKFTQEATRTGPSSWAQMANNQQDVQKNQAIDAAGGQAAGQAAQAESALARSGGMSSGAQERVQRDASRGQTGAIQGITQQAGQNKMQIGMNDEKNRMSELSQLPGMEVAATQPGLAQEQLYENASNADINHSIAESSSQNQFNQNSYNTAAGIWGAGMQASAQDPKNPNSPNADDGKRWYNPLTWF